MKKVFLNCILLLCALIVGSGNLWGADVVGTINFGSAQGSTNVNDSPVKGNDSQGNEWTVTTAGTTSFTPNADYAQIGSSKKPASSITFTTTLASAQTIKAFSAKFGGFSGTHGAVTLKVGETSVGTGSLNESTDVTVSATNTTTSGTVLTVTVTGISKGVKAYYISYTYENSTPTHTLTYSATNGSITGVDGGSNPVTTGASVAESATVTLTATPSSGYRFSSWSVDGTGSTLSSTSTNPTTFTMGTANATVTANFEEVVATPTFDPDGSATYTEAQNVAISCVTLGATIHYTTNGDDPTESDPTYTSPVSITTSKTVLKAKAFKAGLPASDVASATYTIKPSAPTFNLDGGSYMQGTSITLTAAVNNTIYYNITTDGSTPLDPTNESTEYTSSISLGSGTTKIKAIAYDANGNAGSVTMRSYSGIAPATLPFNWYGTSTSGKEDLASKTGVVLSLAADYAASNAPYRLKFDGEGKYVMIFTDDKPTTVSFTAKLFNATTTGSIMKIQGSVDGVSFTDIEEFTIDGAANATFEKTTSNAFAANHRVVKILLSTKDQNVGVGNITVSGAKTITLASACTDGDLYYGTYSCSKAFIVPSDLIVSEIGIEDKKLKVEDYATGAVVPANTGVMISSDVAGDHTITLSSAAGTSVLGVNNMLKPTGEGITSTAMEAASASGTKFYRLTMHNADLEHDILGTIGFWYGAEGGVAFDYSTANRAYLAVPSGAQAPARFWFTEEENNATNIEAVEAAEEGVKFIQNGKLFIKKNGVVYDMLGTVVR